METPVATKHSPKASVAVILAGVLWGIISLFIRQMSAGGLDALQIALVRMATAVLLLWGWMLLRCREKLRIRWKDLWIFVCTGIVSLTFFNTCYFYTLIHTDASVAVVLLYTSPVFIMLLSALFFKERITWKKRISLFLTLVGCALVAGISGGGFQLTLPVFLAGIGSGLFYALYTIFGRIALAKYDSITVTAYTFLFGFLGILPFGKPEQTARAFTLTPGLIPVCLGIGLVSTVLPYFLYTWGLQRMESGKAAILVAVEPLVGAVIGMTVYGESHDIPKLIGIFCILGAIVLLGRQTDTKVPPAKKAEYPQE